MSNYKYKCFWFEVSEDNNMFFINIYYNGTQAHTVKGLNDTSVSSKAKRWVDSYGYGWLGAEDE